MIKRSDLNIRMPNLSTRYEDDNEPSIDPNTSLEDIGVDPDEIKELAEASGITEASSYYRKLLVKKEQVAQALESGVTDKRGKPCGFKRAY